MPIRSQFDTSMYGNRGRQTSLAEVMGAIQSVQGMVERSRAIKQQEQSLDDDRYLNDLYAKTFSDWDGQNIDDFQKRNTTLMSQVAKGGRSHLYNKALGMSNQLQAALQNTAIYKQDMATKKLKADKEKWEYEKEKVDYYNEQLDYVGNQFMSVIYGDQSFNSAVANIRRRPSTKDIQLPTEEEFYANPNGFTNSLLTQSEGIRRYKEQLDMQAAQLGIKKTQGDLKWQDALAQADLYKAYKTGQPQPAPEGGTTKDWMKGKADIDRKYKPIEEQLATADIVISALQSGNPAAIEPIKTKIMRMFGEVGTMTDKDINRAGGNPAVKNKIERWISKGMKGLPPKQDIIDFINLVEISKKSTIDRLNTMLDQQEKIYANRGIDVSDITEQYRRGDGSGETGNTLKSNSGNIYNLD